MTTVRTLCALMFFLIIAPAAQAEEASLTKAEVETIQYTLFEWGYTLVGFPDGVIGPKTREAIAKWQQNTNRAETGVLTREEADYLIQLEVPTNWLWGAISASTDRAYSWVARRDSGLAAYTEALNGCRGRSNSPDKCAVVAGASNGSITQWVAAVHCDQDEGAVNRFGISLSSAASYDRAVELAFENAILAGYYRGNCSLLYYIAADGSHQ